MVERLVGSEMFIKGRSFLSFFLFDVGFFFVCGGGGAGLPVQWVYVLVLKTTSRPSRPQPNR